MIHRSLYNKLIQLCATSARFSLVYSNLCRHINSCIAFLVHGRMSVARMHDVIPTRNSLSFCSLFSRPHEDSSISPCARFCQFADHVISFMQHEKPPVDSACDPSRSLYIIIAKIRCRRVRLQGRRLRGQGDESPRI